MPMSNDDVGFHESTAVVLIERTFLGVRFIGVLGWMWTVSRVKLASFGDTKDCWGLDALLIEYFRCSPCILSSTHTHTHNHGLHLGSCILDSLTHCCVLRRRTPSERKKKSPSLTSLPCYQSSTNVREGLALGAVCLFPPVLSGPSHSHCWRPVNNARRGRRSRRRRRRRRRRRWFHQPTCLSCLSCRR